MDAGCLRSRSRCSIVPRHHRVRSERVRQQTVAFGTCMNRINFLSKESGAERLCKNRAGLASLVPAVSTLSLPEANRRSKALAKEEIREYSKSTARGPQSLYG
jgi:hypothetical protein